MAEIDIETLEGAEELQDAMIEAIAQQNYELYMELAASLGELIVKQRLGIDLGDD